jgi:hypothetical protein
MGHNVVSKHLVPINQLHGVMSYKKEILDKQPRKAKNSRVSIGYYELFRFAENVSYNKTN